MFMTYKKANLELVMQNRMKWEFHPVPQKKDKNVPKKIEENPYQSGIKVTICEKCGMVSNSGKACDCRYGN
jgi:hypothetical protein